MRLDIFRTTNKIKLKVKRNPHNMMVTTMMNHAFRRCFDMTCSSTTTRTRQILLFSTTNSCLSLLTPGQAGRQAEELVRKMLKEEQQQPESKNDPSSRFNNNSNFHMDTILAHAGISSSNSSNDKDDDDVTHNNNYLKENIPLAPPMNFATTYTRAADGTYPTTGGAVYSRNDNPTRRLLEEHIAILECHGGPNFENNNDNEQKNQQNHQPPPTNNTAVCCAFASGMMAASSIILAHKAPTRVLLPHDLYHGVSTVLLDVFTRFQVAVERVDMRNLMELRQALLEIKAAHSADGRNDDVIVWIETPSNPLCHVLDIQAISQLVRDTMSSSATTATVVVDSTLAPPTIQQPLRHGADVVLHAATKYMAGHSDALIGVVTCSPWTRRGQDLGPILQQVHQSVGGVASTMDSWLTLRGLRTLSTRVTKQCETAMTLATFLQQQPSVVAVYYPGLSSSTSSSSRNSVKSRQQAEVAHEIAQRQMRAFGGVLSVEMQRECHAMAVAGALQTIYRATSLGGTETLIEHRRSIEPPDRATSPPGLLRISVGLEDANDLLRDLQRALDIAQLVVNEDEAR